MLERPVRFILFYVAVSGLLCYLGFKRRQFSPAERTVFFEEHPEPAVRSLNLSH